MGVGANQVVNSNGNRPWSVHAEVAAVIDWVHKKRNDPLKPVDVIVVRVTPVKKLLRYSKPCADCMAYLESHLNVKRVYYTNESGELISMKARDMFATKNIAHVSLGNRRLKAFANNRDG